MDNADVDLLIFLAIIGAAVVICGALMCGIYRLIVKIQNLHEARRRRETVAAVRLYHLVQQRVPGGELTLTEFDRAVRYTLRKYRMDDRDGGIDTRRQDIGYIADLVAEAVGQDRLSRGTLAIAAADREIIRSHLKKGERTA